MFRLVLRWVVVGVVVAASGPVAGAREPVRTWEGSITLPTYPWYEDVNPVFRAFENRIYYPYSRQDLIAKEAVPRTYRTLNLENEYLRVTCIPELGGRIHSVLNKVTGEEMFHTNEEIKPALIAMRGAWISGGIEWNPGPQGHTVTILEPVDVRVIENADGSATLHVANIEMMFRTRWRVAVTLHPGRAALDQAFEIANPTDGVHPYYFWNCTAFPNLPGTRYIIPMTLGTDHYGTSFYSWPIHEGVDLTYLKNYPTMTNTFGYGIAFDFFGAYDVDRDRGVVAIADHRTVPGRKGWTWGQDDFGLVSQMALSDADPVDAQYIEVQTGPLLTQSDYGMLQPRQRVAWEETWYPVHGLGDGFEYANARVAANATRSDGTLELRLLGTEVVPGAHLSLRHGDASLLETGFPLSPIEPALAILHEVPEGPIAVTVTDGDGAILLQYETPLVVPFVEEPDLTSGTPEEPTADDLFAEAWLKDSQSDAPAARAGYEKVLAVDPQHAGAHLGLATLNLEQSRFEEAAEHARRARAAAPSEGRSEGELLRGEAWVLHGIAHLLMGEVEKAEQVASVAIRRYYNLARARDLHGRALMRMGRAADAVRAFHRAMLDAETGASYLLSSHSDAWLRQPALMGPDAQARRHWLAARLATGDATVHTEARHLFDEEDPLDHFLGAIAGFQNRRTLTAFAREFVDYAGELEFNTLEVALFFAHLGMDTHALQWLEAVLANAPSTRFGLMTRYHAAAIADRLGQTAKAAYHRDLARAGNPDFVHPARVEDEAVLRAALAKNAEDAHAHLLLGHVLAGLHRVDEALPHWREAVALDETLSTGWHVLGLHARVIEQDHAAAEQHFRKAIAARPTDQVSHYQLFQVLQAQGRRAEGIAMAEAMPLEPTPRYDVILWLADAYLHEGRLDDCIDYLRTARLSNWEGHTRPRDIFVAALMTRGKQAFEAGALEAAAADFAKALTYPENLEVGARYELTDAETRYWLGKALHALGRVEEARAEWATGAAQHTSQHPPLPNIPTFPAQDEHVAKCRAALDALDAGEAIP